MSPRSKPMQADPRDASAALDAEWPRHVGAFFAANDMESFVGSAYDVLRRLVPCDFVSVLYRRAGDRMLRERDSRGREYPPEFMRRNAELTPAIAVVKANHGIKLLATRDHLPSSDDALRRLPYYREIMVAQGWRHAVALCFWDPLTADFPVCVVSAYRVEGRNDFADAELASLEKIHHWIEPIVMRLHERAAAASVNDGMASTLRNDARGIVVLDWRLRAVRANRAARRLCAAWNANGHTADSARALSVPECLLAACRTLQQEWQQELSEPSPARIVRRRSIEHPAGGLSATVALVCRNGDDLAEPGYVLEMAALPPLAGLARETWSPGVLSAMTSAERAVALVAAEGLTNQEIADRLGKSIHAVKFLLHNVYRKAGISNRARLVALLRTRQSHVAGAEEC